MREIINLQVGSCGNQIGGKVSKVSLTLYHKAENVVAIVRTVFRT